MSSPRKVTVAEAARLVQPSDSDEDGVEDTSSSESEEEDALYVRDEDHGGNGEPLSEADAATTQAAGSSTSATASNEANRLVTPPTSFRSVTMSKRTLEEGDYFQLQQDPGVYAVRDGRDNVMAEWSLQPSSQRSRRLHVNVTRERPGLVGEARKATSALEAFLLFLPEYVIDETLKHTNEKLLEEKTKYEAATADPVASHAKEYALLTRTELLAFLGLSLLRGCMGRNATAEELFRGPYAPAPFTATFSFRRYLKLLRCLRFDDVATRDVRREGDKFCLLRDVFNSFDENLRRHLKPSDDVCVDETLVRFRGRCGFKVYMPSKPGKYGILFRSVADAEFHYIWKLWPYAGKPANPQKVPTNSSFATVLDLVRYLTAELRGSGRNVTMDRYFTSFDVMRSLMADRLSVVGTLQANRRLIPAQMKASKGRQPGSTIACYRDQATLVSYCPKPGKVVLAASTFHETAARVDAKTGKPEVILHYNATKGGVDLCDAMLEAYSTRVPTRRWTTSVFLFMVGVAALNAYHVFITNVPDSEKSNARRGGRRLFLQDLGLALCKLQMEERAAAYVATGGHHRHIVVALERCLGRPLVIQPVTDPAPSVAPSRCHVCLGNKRGAGYRAERNKMKKVKTVCSTCGRHACEQHFSTVRRCDKCQLDSGSE